MVLIVWCVVSAR